MNILVDRHHAGLFHSLQLLFGDRLGHTLYTPIGHEWWDEGVWRFGQNYGDDRLARQFLVPGQHIMYDDEFPDRSIYGVSLAEAMEMDWGAVIATVQDNEAGFYRFAKSMGAKYILGVGNTNQRINWDLDPLVLNSSEMPLLGRGVHIGQEFDSDRLFAYVPPLMRNVISSFVNCMPSIACYPWLEWARDELDTFVFQVHGIDGPEGNLKPITATRNVMVDSGWAWHDKEHGDGYGHVIHYWAAIGRPLIGHGSHYAGKNAQVFWRDLETCIDLDKHSLSEALDLIRAITNDKPRHTAMCAAIRAVFDETTDWQGDADKVRALIA